MFSLCADILSNKSLSSIIVIFEVYKNFRELVQNILYLEKHLSHECHTYWIYNHLKALPLFY